MTGWAKSPPSAIPWLALAMVAILLAACTPDGRPGGTTARGNPRELVTGRPASPRATGAASANYKVGSAYQVEGQWYYPKVDLAYDERGVASWYGPNFDGRRTANGEIFDMRLISAAHKTLQLPSVVRVTNLENGRSLVIRINDRGPFVRGRIIDLSRRAAELLGFTAKGTAMVHIRLLPRESRQAALEAGATSADMVAFGPPAPKAAPNIPVSVEVLAPVVGVAVAGPAQPATASSANAPAGQGSTRPPYGGMTAIASKGAIPQVGAASVQAAIPEARPAPIDVAGLPTREQVEQVSVDGRPKIFIQAGAFRQFVNANRLRSRLTTLGHAVRVSQVYVNNGPFFRVRLGPMNTVEDADRALERVVTLGYPEARIIVD